MWKTLVPRKLGLKQKLIATFSTAKAKGRVLLLSRCPFPHFNSHES